MKFLLLLLVVMFAMLQYKIWFAPGGVVETLQLKRSIEKLNKKNQALSEKNAILKADVKDLKTGYNAIEERARNELGMIKRNEVFYQVVQ